MKRYRNRARNPGHSQQRVGASLQAAEMPPLMRMSIQLGRTWDALKTWLLG